MVTVLSVKLFIGAFFPVTGEYIHDAGTIYYNPKIENKLSHSFCVFNPFKTNMKLSLSDKTCGCVLTDIVENEILPRHFTDIVVSFNFDEMAYEREEVVTFTTNQKDLPEIKLTVKVITIPYMRINNLRYYPPSLSKDEEANFLADAVFYVDTIEATENVGVTVEGPGFDIISNKPSIKKVDNKFMVTINSRLIVKNSNLVSFTSSRMPGKLVLRNGGTRIEKDVFWMPVFPFDIDPESVFLAKNKGESIIEVQFKGETTILSAAPSNPFINVSLEKIEGENKYKICVMFAEDVKVDLPNDLFVLIKTSLPEYKDIKIPVHIW
ncbi:MAG: DUF1573 domain-containing protein [Planctomycetaceae bacterium]|nr:DUF1573 domain-containing protein [Planctomycetaceae bacterium]